MSDKEECPVCKSYTSDIYEAFRNGTDCPSCGASSTLIRKIESIKEERIILKKQGVQAGVVEENAQLKLKVAHMEEILKVAKDICLNIQADYDSLYENVEKLGELDFEPKIK